MKNYLKKWSVSTASAFLLMIGAGTNSVSAQQETITRKINYTTFLEQVFTYNPEYSAERAGLNVAAAEAEQSRVFEDPELSFSYTDNGQRRMKMGYGFAAELGWGLDISGKRAARIKRAKAAYEVQDGDFRTFAQAMRREATESYLEALYNKEKYVVLESSFKNISKIATSDSIRFHLGYASKMDARQSNLEALTMKNELYQGESALTNALISLYGWMGQFSQDTILDVSGDWVSFDRLLSLDYLKEEAKQHRVELVQAEAKIKEALYGVKETKADRIPDLGLSAGIEYNSEVTNAIAPTPSHAAVSVGVSIPIMFSNRNKGAMKAAEYTLLQVRHEQKAIELQIDMEVTQAYNEYMALQRTVKLFDSGLLSEAEAILEAKIYSYHRGEVVLLEVLDAQRTYNEIQQSYIEALYERALALVELEVQCGIWDINF